MIRFIFNGYDFIDESQTLPKARLSILERFYYKNILN
jgi:hypothetical protein